MKVQEQIAVNELARGLETEERIYAFCPFCNDLLEISPNQVESREGGKLRLKDPVSCSCRKDLRFVVSNDLLKPRFQRNTRFQMMSTGICAAVALVCGLGFWGGILYNENAGIHNDALAYIVLSLPFIGGIAFICMLICLIFPMEKHFMYWKYELPPYDPYKEIRRKIESREKKYEWLARHQKPERPKRWEDGLHSLGQGSDYVPERDAPGRTAASSGMAAATGLHLYDDTNDDPENSFQNAYIPDDFEPDMDPYDREALYDESMIDGWIIAGGGNPYDLDTRMDALSDPFDPGGDGWSD